MVKSKKPKAPKNKEAKETLKAEKDFTIYGVKKKQDFLKIKKELPRPLMTMVERGGGCLQIYSPPGSGKSNFLVNLFLRESMFKDVFEGALGFLDLTIYYIIRKL